MASSHEVRRQYERWPYPHVPLFGAVRRLDTWQLNVDFLSDRCGMGPAPARPRIWIAGCGTMQPYVFRLANPSADILATDLSARSLRIARRRCDWHGQKRIEFARVDLTDASSMPDGPFDLIECYGVLMNLADPHTALRELARRLSPHGVLRIMVYPHFSRRRIFQVQRLAKLCGFRFEASDHPRRLRYLIAALPRAHPLRYAFEDYTDSRNDAGLVDGFLHAGDRGFSGIQLRELCRGAGLRVGCWFARPFARPDRMAAPLGLAHADEFFVAHYLDLWQELRGNFVVCLVRDDDARSSRGDDVALRAHPLLTGRCGRGADSFAPLDIVADVWALARGVRLRSRLDDEPIVLSAAEVRSLRDPASWALVDRATLDRWRTLGVLLGGAADRSSHAGPTPIASFENEPSRIEIAGMHPLYAHLFEALRHDARTTDGVLGTRDEQLARWQSIGDALETSDLPMGLTPLGTWRHARRAVESLLSDARTVESVSTWAEWPLADAEHRRVRDFLAHHAAPVSNEGDAIDPAASAELWALLFCADQLALPATAFART